MAKRRRLRSKPLEGRGHIFDRWVRVGAGHGSGTVPADFVAYPLLDPPARARTQEGLVLLVLASLGLGSCRPFSTTDS
jgi:hypothetical protein